MELETLTRFFLWCTVLNGALLLLWTVLFLGAPDWIYRTQTRWFPMPRETFNVIFYAFIGLFKIVFLVFNVVPYAALLIVR